MATTTYNWEWARSNRPNWTNGEEANWNHCVECIKKAVALTRADGIYQNYEIDKLMSQAYNSFRYAAYHYNTELDITLKFAELVKAAHNDEL